MRIDLHIHSNLFAPGRIPPLPGDEMVERLHRAGFDGGVILSHSPIEGLEFEVYPAKKRLEMVMEYTKDHKELLPFYFLDPTEPDALDQVERALDAGIRGFKTICTHFYPGDERAIPVYHRIAEANKPYLFHSGILYDANNPSGNFNRPCNFEVLLKVPKLRFALAHISWPWCDECIAVFGKFANYLATKSAENAPEMFVDITPGTPPLYRREALMKLLAMHGASKQVLWGSDNSTHNYNVDYALQIRTRDEAIAQEFGFGKDFLEDLYANNFDRFLNGPKK